MSYDIDSKCKTHLLDRNFSTIKFLLPPEVFTVDTSGKVISLKNLDFPWKSGDFGVLLVEISSMLPLEISAIFFSPIRPFTEKKVQNPRISCIVLCLPPVSAGFARRSFIFILWKFLASLEKRKNAHPSGFVHPFFLI